MAALGRRIESYERSPLIRSAGVNSLYSQTPCSRLEKYVRDQRAAWESFFEYTRYTWKRYLEDFRYALPLVWPDKGSGLQYRPIQCFGIFLVHRILYLLVPYLTGSLVKALENGVRDMRIWALLCGVLICPFVKDYLCKNLQSWLWLEVALRSQQVIALKFWDKIFDYPEDERWATGGLLSDFNKGGCLNKCLEQALFIWTATSFDLITTAISVCSLLGITCGVLSITISLSYIYCIARNARRSLPWSRGVVETKRQKDAIAKPALGAVLDIVLQNGIEREANRFKTAQDSYHYQKLKSSIASIFRSTLANTVFFAGSSVMSAFTVWQITNKQRATQHFVILLALMRQLQETLDLLGASVQKFVEGVVETERTLGVLKDKPKIRNPTDAREIIEAADIEFESVKAGSLKSLTFRCKEGTITAILGLPDHERPILGHLLFRITESQNGIIRIGGIDIREYSIGLLQRKIGFIPRKCKLLGGTIMQSLKYGLRNSESIKDERVFAACREVNIYDTIMKTVGYSAPLKENSLSGKVKRRLALARLHLQDPRILVIDGAIAAIEGETDEDLQNMLRVAFNQRTVLVVDHRMHAVKSARQILRLHGNALVELGTGAALGIGSIVKTQEGGEKG
ncbi:P-loop containing nucleoside triphosphate hydrolase protein [Hyaloscypha sp. PMI_1271]|nr:P-loop containing nucleoside triphosphate hydrolase protein [Hyaloscypha sp. PMI_1271]